MTLELDRATVEDFIPCVDDAFVIDGETALRLVEARALGENPEYAPRRFPFSLLFTGPPEPLLSQGSYRLTNEKLGVIEIFIVPIGPDERGQRYEAVFN
jgi:hypothetical protein